MELADGDAEGVGGVVGFWDGVEVEEYFDHLLYLFFVGFAVAGDGGFHFSGGEFADGEAGLGGGEGDDAAGLGYGDASGDVFGEEEFFDCDGLGGVDFDEVYDFVVDGLEALCEVVVWGGGDGAVGDVGEFVAFLFDDAVAGGGGAWIEAEYAHCCLSFCWSLCSTRFGVVPFLRYLIRGLKPPAIIV